MPTSATMRLPNSIAAWPPFSGNGLSPQRGQLSQPRPEAVSRTTAPLVTTTQSVKTATVASWTNRRADTARARTPLTTLRASSPTSTLFTETPHPSRRRRGRSGRARAPGPRTWPSSTARLVRRQRDEQPACRLWIVGERLVARRAALSTCGPRTPDCGGRLPCAPRPRRARARRAARGVRRRRARSGRRLRTAISCAWPSSPNPVTSVTAFGANGRSASAASRLSVRIATIAASSAPVRRAPVALRPGARGPVPSGFVRKSASPGCAALLGQIPSGCTVPTTASPYFGSSSRIVCPPARIAPRRAHASSAPAEDLAEHLGRQLLRERGHGEGEQRRPPIANTSLSAFVAAIRRTRAGRRRPAGRSRP